MLGVKSFVILHWSSFLQFFDFVFDRRVCPPHMRCCIYFVICHVLLCYLILTRVFADTIMQQRCWYNRFCGFWQLAVCVIVSVGHAQQVRHVVSSLSVPRERLAAGSLGSKLFFAGGTDSIGASAQVDVL